MALIKCKECGTGVSSKADKCPKCGAQIARKPLGCAALIGIVFAITLGVVFISSLVQNGGSETPPQTAEQKATAQKEKTALWLANEGAAILKKSMRDPDSFKVDQALAMDDTHATCYTYRSRNGFGGMNSGQAVFTVDGTLKSNESPGFSKLWNKHCANKQGSVMDIVVN